jgi:hypothetical protein
MADNVLGCTTSHSRQPLPNVARIARKPPSINVFNSAGAEKPYEILEKQGKS